MGISGVLIMASVEYVCAFLSRHLKKAFLASFSLSSFYTLELLITTGQAIQQTDEDREE